MMLQQSFKLDPIDEVALKLEEAGFVDCKITEHLEQLGFTRKEIGRAMQELLNRRYGLEVLSKVKTNLFNKMDVHERRLITNK